jgi:hypothetical protein
MQPLTSSVPVFTSPALFSALRSPAAAREVRRNSPLRQARTCYSHLAGVAGVQLLEALLGLGWFQPQQDQRLWYRLTPQGSAGLASRGVNLCHLSTRRRSQPYGCLDWTERRPHLAGALAVAIVEALETSGFIQRTAGSRTVTILRPLAEWLEAPQACSPVGNLISSAQ